MARQIAARKAFSEKEWSVVFNLGPSITLPDGSPLGQYCSGLFKDMTFEGESLLVFPIGPVFDGVPAAIVEHCRNNFTPVCKIYPKNFTEKDDFFRSEKYKVGEMELNFWYCGPGFNCGIHNEHPFYEVHTQIMGHGEMQMFRENNEETIYHREILSPGQSHRPFCNAKHIYPWHRYKSRTSCLFLAIESPTPLIPTIKQ